MRAQGRVPYRGAAMTAVALLSTVVGLATWTSPAESKPDYLTQFNSKYDTRGSRLDTCQTCHTSSAGNATNVNPYGMDFGKNNHDLAAVEGLDSDGDGFTNIDEIKALTFPGDPNENQNNKPEPKPKPTTTTTTTSPSPIPGLPKLPIHH